MNRNRNPIKNIAITTVISPDFHKKAIENGITWQEAMRVGIGVLLEEKGIEEYSGTLNLKRKMQGYQAKLIETLKQLEETQARLNIKEGKL